MNQNFTDHDRDKAFGFFLLYNYFRQPNNTFLSIGSELDAGLALFCL